jgi:hypothetical protein
MSGRNSNTEIFHPFSQNQLVKIGMQAKSGAGLFNHCGKL